MIFFVTNRFVTNRLVAASDRVLSPALARTELSRATHDPRGRHFVIEVSIVAADDGRLLETKAASLRHTGDVQRLYAL